VRDVRPKNIGTVLDEALALFRANAKPLLIAAAITVLPAALLMGLGQDFYYRGIFEGSLSASGPSDLVVTSMLVSYMVIYLASMILLFGKAYLDSSILSSAAEMLHRQVPAAKPLLKGGLARFGWYLLAQFMVSIAVSAAAFASFFVLGVGGLVLYVYLSLTGAVIVVERANLGDAFRRSMDLVKGNFWRVSGYLVLVWLLMTAFQGALGSPVIIRQIVASAQNPEAIFQPVSLVWKVLEGLTLGFAIALPAPFAPLATFALYLDLRARNEGMDLVIRARELRDAA
jgi:hypothetical protein